MAWHMPGQWNPGVPQMTPDLSMSTGMGSYSAEQWAAMQQQNWQQWTQWQQQYAQWQTQYGEKYAEQMQSMQGMAIRPPLPPANSAPPPAPPPPEKPPPPPHENNQPLFGQANPVPAPGSHTQRPHAGNSNNISIPTGNTWQHGTETHSEAFFGQANPVPATGPQTQMPHAGSSNNISTPTGNTWQHGTETRSEAFFGQANPVPATGPQTQMPHAGSSNNISTPTGNTWQHGTETRSDASQHGVNTEALKKLAEEERLFDIQFEKWEEEIQKWKRENVNHPDRQAYNEYEQKFETCRAQLLERRQVMKQKRARLLGQAPPAAGNNTTGTGNIPTTVLPLLQTPNNNQQLHMQSQNLSNPPRQTINQNQQQDHSPNNYKPNQMPNQNFKNKPPQHHQEIPQFAQYTNNMQSQAGFNRNDNKNVSPQDRFESYQQQNTQNENYSSSNPLQALNVSQPNFLPGLESAKGIPGLDLVPEDKVGSQQQQDVIDITDETPTAGQLPPDYTTISKGINNILGDAKIMNILSMVRDQGVPHTPTNIQGSYVQKPPFNSNDDKYNAPSNNQWDINQNSNKQHYENSPSNVSFNRRGPGYPPDQNQEQNSQHYPPQRIMNKDRENDMTSEPYYDRNPQFSAQNMYPRGPPPMRLDMPPPRPLMQGVRGYQNDGGFPGGRPRGPTDVLRPMRPNVPPPRPLIQGMAGQEDDNTYSMGAHGNRPFMNNNMVNPAMNKPPPPINKPPPPIPQPERPKWVEEPLFTPSIIVEYEHKPLRLKAREFIEPVHIFEYSHKSKDSGNNKKIDFEREADELFARKPRRIEAEDTFQDNRFSADMSRPYIPRDYERRYPREEFRDDLRDIRGPPRQEFDDRRRPDERGPPREEYYDRRRLDVRGPPRQEFDDRRRPDERGLPREEYDDRRRSDDRFDEKRRDDRVRYNGREDFCTDREDLGPRDRQRDFRRDDFTNRSRSRDRDSRKRGRSRESTLSENSTQTAKKSKEPEKKPEAPKHVVMIDDLLEPPGREMRPEKIVIILRGPPGSGKSYLAKLIRDREAEHGGTARIMSIDDYFMQEGEIEEKDPVTGKIVKKPSLKYEYEAKSEETYLNSLKRAFKRSLTDGYFTFLIYDAVNDTLRSYADMWNFARQNGFQVYICTMELDSQICFKRNIHGRTLGDVQVICTRFFPTPDHHIQLDATSLLQNAAIPDVEMEDIDDEVIMEDAQEPEVESSFTSKWEKLDDAAQLARLDGTSKPLRPSQPSMEDYLQLDDWKPTTAKPGKKSVRWADIEESREQEKMRAIGFVVGQTDWNRMTDPTMGSSALTQTKYIERVKRNCHL